MFEDEPGVAACLYEPRKANRADEDQGCDQKLAGNVPLSCDGVNFDMAAVNLASSGEVIGFQPGKRLNGTGDVCPAGKLSQLPQ